MVGQKEITSFKIANIPGDGIGKEVLPRDLGFWTRWLASSASSLKQAILIGVVRHF